MLSAKLGVEENASVETHQISYQKSNFNAEQSIPRYKVLLIPPQRKALKDLMWIMLVYRMSWTWFLVLVYILQ